MNGMRFRNTSLVLNPRHQLMANGSALRRENDILDAIAWK